MCVASEDRGGRILRYVCIHARASALLFFLASISFFVVRAFQLFLRAPRDAYDVFWDFSGDLGDADVSGLLIVVGRFFAPRERV